ncbi:hypothetical protein [Methylobacterium isbiliense]|uniref:hypothetical protein n=1 Tax=Methylobacterium isbiliense TaxID=315478 RepID=UPI0025B4C1A2|nr:hypothetical protein [Methylobacterium isbiliense]MDN3625021.1 hypothetical protein [Methylobacterium isbiliense]
MVVALYALALLMVLGGLASVVQGIPYVRLEIGWTMVIAGTVAASGGSVLLGLAAVVARLHRMERLMGQGAAPRAARPVRNLPPLPAMPEPAPAAPEPTPSPVAAALGQAGVPGAAALAATELRPSRTEPEAETPELRLTRAEPDEAPRDEPGPAAPPEPAPGPPPASEPPPAQAGAPEPASPPEPAAPPAEPEPPAAPEAPSIVGTYASGGNTYVMYSDGTIDADTPGGKFHFASLDELKVFIAEGGEGGEGARSGTA